MTDWDLMTEYIKNAMYELDKTHAATSQVRESVTPETLNNFLAQIQVLTENLPNLQTVLNHQEAFPVDELTGWLRRAFTGETSNYRRTLRIQFNTRSFTSTGDPFGQY